jgi:hypothetical protein
VKRPAFLIAVLLTWWLGFWHLVPWVQRVTHFHAWANTHAKETVLGHWFFWQLPGVLCCIVLWLIGQRLGMMPSFVGAFGSGGSWRRVVGVGLAATAIMSLITFTVGPAVGGHFRWHFDGWSALGNLVSNMYEELTHRGLIFCAAYGVAAGATFPLRGPLDRAGIIAGVCRARDSLRAWRLVRLALVARAFVVGAVHHAHPRRYRR